MTMHMRHVLECSECGSRVRLVGVQFTRFCVARYYRRVYLEICRSFTEVKGPLRFRKRSPARRGKKAEKADGNFNLIDDGEYLSRESKGKKTNRPRVSRLRKNFPDFLLLPFLV